MTTTEKPSPIEVWLSKQNIEVTCMVVHEDESTDNLDVESLSMRGAQREITGLFLRRGYKPVGRWETEVLDDDDDPAEAKRQFKLA